MSDTTDETERPTMNRYGRQAQKHWQEFLPERYREIENPEEHFTRLGALISEEINTRAAAIAGPDPEGETSFMTKLGRLNEAQMTATDEVLREMLPEPDSDVPQTTP
jgi:hypothetical protein